MEEHLKMNQPQEANTEQAAVCESTMSGHDRHHLTSGSSPVVEMDASPREERISELPGPEPQELEGDVSRMPI